MKKMCNRCHRMLPNDVEHFYVRRDKKVGFGTVCRECQSTYYKKYYLEIVRGERIKKSTADKKKEPDKNIVPYDEAKKIIEALKQKRLLIRR